MKGKVGEVNANYFRNRGVEFIQHDVSIHLGVTQLDFAEMKPLSIGASAFKDEGGILQVRAAVARMAYTTV
jgi:hypothetical protein